MIDEVRQGSEREREREHIQSILSWSAWSVPYRKFRTAVNTSQPPVAIFNFNSDSDSETSLGIRWFLANEMGMKNKDQGQRQGHSQSESQSRNEK